MSSQNNSVKNILLISTFFMTNNSLSALLGKESDRRAATFSFPQGLLCIAATTKELHKDEFSFELLDLNKELYFHCKNIEREKLSIRQFILSCLNNQVCKKPDVVGISINFSTGHGSAVTLAECLKEKWPTVKIVFGGNHSTNYTKNLLNQPSIDYVIRGQADHTFPQFLISLQKRQDPTEIAGIIGSPDQDLSLSMGATNLDELPLMSYDLLDMEKYITETGRTVREEDTRAISYDFSRGCSFNCIFCSSHTIHSRKVVTKSSKKSIEELKFLVEKYSINTVVVEDDLFGANKKIFYQFCDDYEKSGLNLRFVFPNAFSVAILDEKMIDRLVDIGLQFAILAIESGSPYVQKNIIRKNCRLDKAVRISKYIRQKGIRLSGYFIMGFPGETKEMMAETRAVAKDLELDWAEFFVASPLPGSKMTQQLFETGVITDDTFMSIINNTDLRKRLYDTPEISAKDLENYVYESNIQINFFNNYNMLNGETGRAIKIFSEIITTYHFHIVALACRARCYARHSKFKQMHQDHNQIQKLIDDKHPESISLQNRYEEEIKKFTQESESFEQSS
jgi:anaerobic magnesium-protoporphyrin IX monomethyl ester cyclase